MKHDVLKFKPAANRLRLKFTRIVFAPETIKSDEISKSKLVAFISSFEESIVKFNKQVQI